MPHVTVKLRLIILFSALGGYYRAEGLIKNVNTIEEYRNIDKAHMLRQSGETVSRNKQRMVDYGIANIP